MVFIQQEIKSKFFNLKIIYYKFKYYTFINKFLLIQLILINIFLW
jgi:hypothetical protein